ncbi:putative toxin-antitoxin system toxin component, PIN family [Paraburkholderia phymatum]|uniref:putative toxin-antitoxin system toxin component, PIN family n=1 Tax=Paraburkholderia phymatum TaxID=148447 RepID=UPI0031764C7A
MPETPALPQQNAFAATPAVVLDSNVWIDILVFDDPHTRPILAALERGALRALIDARCLAELTHVLDYPQFEKRAIDKADALARLARLSTLVEPPVPAENADQADNAGDTRPLPKCKDRDDQKFLELAHAMQADWLISKDRAVLKLAKRIARDFGFRIAQPAPFVAECALVSGEPVAA